MLRACAERSPSDHSRPWQHSASSGETPGQHVRERYSGTEHPHWLDSPSITICRRRRCRQRRN